MQEVYYERELIGERIRDKVAASKKLGYWLGGTVPLGYECQNRSFVINKKEAEIVRDLYEKFSDLKSITRLLEYAKTNGLKTKAGKSFSKNTIRHILTNPIYKGYITHKTKVYKGLHKDIIDEDFFDEVQKMFNKDSDTENQREDSKSLLKDIIKCGVCDCSMAPTRCNKHKRKYRYYTCPNHIRKKECTSANKNVPAGDVEGYVCKAICTILEDPIIVSETLNKLDNPDLNESLKDIKGIWENLHFNERKRIVSMLITNVIVDNNGQIFI